MADDKKRPRPSLRRRVLELAPEDKPRRRGRPPKPAAGVRTGPGDLHQEDEGAPAPPTPTAPEPVPPTPWKPVAVQLAAQLDPLYVALCEGWHPTPEQWEHFTMAWGAVVDHYAPAVGGSIWTPALTASALMGWPLVAGYLAMKRAKAEAEAAEQLERERARDAGPARKEAA